MTAAHVESYTRERIQSLAEEVGRLRQALELVHRGLQRGKIPDQSILNWPGAAEGDLTALSDIVCRALETPG